MMTIQHCWWQIIVAAIIYWALGALWFNPKVFGTVWQASHGLKVSEEDKAKVNMGKLMGLSFLCTLFLSAAVCSACCNMCTMCMPDDTIRSGGLLCCIKGGLLVGGAATAAISMAYIYQMKPMNAYLTDCGYHVTGCVAVAVLFHILGCC